MAFGAKSDEDAQKKKKGELIEPLKPIVYYIDPARENGKIHQQGIDDWQVAFEAAGWKNAIRGEYWPENDPTMSLEDARFVDILQLKFKMHTDLMYMTQEVAKF
jgi:hypothetical protein